MALHLHDSNKLLSVLCMVYTDEFLSLSRESPWGSTQRDQKIGIEFSEDEYREIEYKSGRVIIIDGGQVHRNMAPTVKNVLRVSLSIHLGRQFEYEIIC